MTAAEVKQFWKDSTHDYLLDIPTGIHIGRTHDWYWKYLDLWEKQVVLQHSRDGLVLDLGCGTGRMTECLRAHGKKVVSVDYIYECLPVVSRQIPHSICANMDATALALKDSSVDCVVACRVLQSLPTRKQKAASLEEIARILRRGGSLILTEGNPVRQKFVRIPYNFFLALREWMELLEDNRLTVSNVYGIPFLSASRALDRISFGLLHRIAFPFRIAYGLDRLFSRSLIKYLSLQFDIIATKR